MWAWNAYYEGLKELRDKGIIELPIILDECKHNALMFYIKTKYLEERSELIEYMKTQGILSVFHYISLHSALAGGKCGRFYREDLHVTRESERLLRLPLYYGISEEDLRTVISDIYFFYS